jgi:hypothetical protein
MEKTDVPEIVEAKEFVLRDEHGLVRARLRLTSVGPAFQLCDRKSVPRISIELQNDKPCVGVMREDGNPLLSFKQLDDGSTILGLSRDDATPALLILVENGKDVRVGLCRSDGEPAWVRVGNFEAG